MKKFPTEEWLAIEQKYKSLDDISYLSWIKLANILIKQGPCFETEFNIFRFMCKMIDKPDLDFKYAPFSNQEVDVLISKLKSTTNPDLISLIRFFDEKTEALRKLVSLNEL